MSIKRSVLMFLTLTCALNQAGFLGSQYNSVFPGHVPGSPTGGSSINFNDQSVERMLSGLRSLLENLDFSNVRLPHVDISSPQPRSMDFDGKKTGENALRAFREFKESVSSAGERENNLYEEINDVVGNSISAVFNLRNVAKIAGQVALGSALIITGFYGTKAFLGLCGAQIN